MPLKPYQLRVPAAQRSPLYHQPHQKNKEVNEWLDMIGDRHIYVGVDGGSRLIDRSQLLEIADRCEWAELRHDTRLADVFHKHLVIGYGDLLEWCRSCGKSENDKAYFLTAS